MRLLVDTNIVLDYLDERPSFFQSARKLMILGFLHELELWMSASQATDLFYLLTNGGRASEAGEVKKSMRQARQFIRICSLTESDVDAALDSSWDDFEDAVARLLLLLRHARRHHRVCHTAPPVVRTT